MPYSPKGGAAFDDIASARSADRIRVLVVDDNRDLADSLALLLRLQGLSVMRAHDGLSAIALAPTFRPHVVLLDCQMPGMAGPEVARTLRGLNLGAMRIIAHTASLPFSAEWIAKSPDFDDYLSKPAALPQLLEAIGRQRARSSAAEAGLSDLRRGLKGYDARLGLSRCETASDFPSSETA